MAFPHIGALELILILVIILIIFGIGRLPKVGGAIGQGLREFRQAQYNSGEAAEEEPRRKKIAPKKVKS